MNYSTAFLRQPFLWLMLDENSISVFTLEFQTRNNHNINTFLKNLAVGGFPKKDESHHSHFSPSLTFQRTTWNVHYPTSMLYN